jgi:hypothetical protein|tara:strand:- start:825 stop:962 length:138 start_codon:yes stop_codon:yes gene_type:complete
MTPFLQEFDAVILIAISALSASYLALASEFSSYFFIQAASVLAST